MFDKILISSGLVLIPLLPLFGLRGRDPKMQLAVFLAMVLGLWGFNKGIKPLKNKAILFFLAFLPISAFFSPRLLTSVMDLKVFRVWMWQPILYSAAFFLMYVSLKSRNIDKKFILKVMTWTGVAIGLHCVGHYFGLYQWMEVNPLRPNAKAASFLSNPCIAGAFIAMIIPLAIYLRNWIALTLLTAGLIATQSALAIGAVFLMLCLLLLTKGVKCKIFASLLIIGVYIAASIGMGQSKEVRTFLGDSGRLDRWKLVVQDLNKPFIDGKPYPYTGFGPGSFRYFFHQRHPDKCNGEYYEAHNEYLEVAYNYGWIGLGLFLFMIGGFFKGIEWDRMNKYLILSFITILVCAGGLFVWHLGEMCFYTVVILGLIKDKEIIYGRCIPTNNLQ